VNPVNPLLIQAVNQTRFLDTHEHLIEESQRLAGPAAGGVNFPCDDWSYLFFHYSVSDLASAGMPVENQQRLYSQKLSPKEKWELFAPYWPACKHTGYFQAARRSLKLLFDEDDLGPHNVGRITEKMRKLTKKGYYQTVLRDFAKVESCQVNCLEHIFRETEYPKLLLQDLSIVALSVPDLDPLERATGKRPATLTEWYAVRDELFERHAPRAVAVKSQRAYGRRLDYENVPRAAAERLFARHAKGEALSPTEAKALEDHLFRACVERATDFRLPVKLHTGYYVGHNYMPLHRLKHNAADVCQLLIDFPRTQFVLMHIGYPYEHEMIALAKHFSNAFVDLCWAWIINPAASTRFVKEFLMAAPATKLLTFGGDYIVVENVVGHAHIARQGLAQALSELVAESWLGEREALDLVLPLMQGNARALFRLPPP
jgi:predicted TIM-barrel fold metal-dependent hydrolase